METARELAPAACAWGYSSAAVGGRQAGSRLCLHREVAEAGSPLKRPGIWIQAAVCTAQGARDKHYEAVPGLVLVMPVDLDLRAGNWGSA